MFCFFLIWFFHHLRLAYPRWALEKECEQLRLVNFLGELDIVPDILFEEDHLEFTEKYSFITYISPDAWYQENHLFYRTKEDPKLKIKLGKYFLYYRDLQVFSSSLRKVQNPRKIMSSIISKKKNNRSLYALYHKENVSRLLLSRRCYQHTHFKHLSPRIHFCEFKSTMLPCSLRKPFSFQTNSQTRYGALYPVDIHQWYRNNPSRF